MMLEIFKFLFENFRLIDFMLEILMHISEYLGRIHFRLFFAFVKGLIL